MILTKQEIEAGRSKKGGWTRKTLESWGVSWPPQKGWKARLLGKKVKHHPKNKKAENSKPSKYMRNPHYETSPVTFYPDRIKQKHSAEIKSDLDWLNYLKRTGATIYISVIEGVEVFNGTVDERIKQISNE